jgi:cation/acetate symporter
MIDVFAITLALMVGTAGLPHVIIRFFTVPKASDARKSAGWALIFIAILYTTAPAVAVFARSNFIDTVNESAWSEEAAANPPPAERWAKAARRPGSITGATPVFWSFTDKNGDGLIQYRADPDDQ